MRRALAGALAALALVLAACGGGGSASVPRGNPDDRRGPTAVDDYAAVEFTCAQVIASSDAFFAGASAADARTQLSRARAGYDVLAGRVKARDPVVDREVVARFNVLARLLRSGIGPDHYRDLASPLGDQLMDGVIQALDSPAARMDRGLQAEALRRVTMRMAADYDAAAAAGSDDPTGRLAFQEAWGLWRRSQVLASNLKPYLGSAIGTVTISLNNLRGNAFPDGPAEPGTPDASKVDAVAQKVTTALVKRFGLTRP